MDRWQQINQLFHSALAHERDQRAAFLAGACAGDEALRAEVESLVASHEQAESFIEQPASDVAAELLAGAHSQLSAGQQLGHYTITSLLGAGGMGEVYLAEDLLLGRRIALKLLPAHFTVDGERVRRFEQEARAASGLNHPNIVTIHEIGRADSAHFIATEFIDGETLRASLSRSRLSLRAALDVAIQVASALVAAHKAGIVHRDIKPENIMVRRDDRVVKVLDFGLAKLLETHAQQRADSAAPTRALVKTGAGVVMGTVSYMSPEQARGLAVDERTDIWSLGVVLYEMVAGRLPFAGETASDCVAAILKTEPPVLTRHAPDVPAELERIVAKALRKDAEERYQSSKELALDLKSLKQRLEFEAELERTGAPERGNAAQRVATGEPLAEIETAPVAAAQTGGASSDIHTTSSAEYIVGEIKRHRRGALVVLTLLVAAIAAIAYFASSRYFAGSGTAGIESVAVLPFVNESGNTDVEYLSDGMTETLISSLSQLPKLNVKARSSVFRYKGKDADAQTIGKELNVQAILNGRVIQRGEQLTLSLELVDARTENVIWSEQYNRRQTDLLALQSEIARDVSQKLKIKLSGADEQRMAKNYTENTEAYQLYLRGNFYVDKRREKDIRKGIEYFEQAIAIDPNYALAYIGLASAYGALPNYSNVSRREVIPKVKDATLKALLLDNNLAEAHTMFGFVLTTDGDLAGAEREYKRAIELNPNSAMAHHFYGNLASRMGRHEEALAKSQRSLEIEPLSLIFNRALGDRLFFFRRYDEAIAQLKKTLELDAGFASAHYMLALAYQMKGNYTEAVEEQAIYQELIGEPQKAALIRESYAKRGWQGFLRTITDERLQFNLAWDDRAPYYAALGEKDKAYAQLNKRYENRKVPASALEGDPRFDPLRDDPRFQELRRRVGLPQ